jgi:small subunit ribosomal protein S21
MQAQILSVLNVFVLFSQLIQNLIMLIINIKDNETIDRALGRYKKKVRDTQLLKEVRRRKSFEKPSITRRGQVLKAVHKLQVQREAEDQ